MTSKTEPIDLVTLIEQEHTNVKAEQANANRVANRPPSLLGQHISDYGNAQRLMALHGGNVRYCHAFEKGLVWDRRRWAVDEGERARDLAQATILEFAHQALTAKATPRRSSPPAA